MSSGQSGAPAMRVLYGATVFSTALLLLLVQPMMAKALLPWFGGSAGVWTCAMLFFQTGLLAGYAYAHWTARHLSPGAQIAVHLLLLAASLAALPIVPSMRWQPPPGEGAPLARLLLILTLSAGLPYLMLSSTTPLVQAWYARRAKALLPYRLFAVSNAASLAGLVVYPVLIEPLIATRRQMLGWSAAYAGAAALSAVPALWSRGNKPVESRAGEPASLHDRLLWIGLAACPSVLWLAMANTLSQSIAPVPLLWVLPFGIYLLTLVLCFDRQGWYRRVVYRWLLPAGWVLIGLALGAQRVLGLPWILLSCLGGLLICCLFCHGELALRRPPVEQLTTYYLMLASGGALGGVFVAVLAPFLFTGYLELPIAVVACVLLALRFVYRVRPRQVARIALTGTAGLIAAVQMDAVLAGSVVRVRNFYGRLQVSDEGGVRVLSNGPIRHGAQFLTPEKRREPAAYFGTDSGIGRVMRFFGGRPLRVGIIGLGAGTLAAYCQPGDTYRFYEINPAVIRVASEQFDFLQQCPQTAVVAGDGRLSLASETAPTFDIFVVDAFSGDSIPTHLLTREAFALYFRRLTSDGALAVHISNRYLDLAPVIAALAADAQRPARLIRSAADPARSTYDATWTVMTANRNLLAEVTSVSEPLVLKTGFRLWTDDYSNLFQVLR
ncbi:MAG: hypothetical protein C5B51_06705 [Terriglobia bacterium]|nr:MAG: hypothetical protein C5B51_06705 [Terriglobia bacterium]